MKTEVKKGRDGVVTKLSELEAGEVSLVPRGANKKKFHILKTAGGVMPEETLQEKIKKTDPELMKKVDTLLKAQKPMPPKEEPAPVAKAPDAPPEAGPLGSEVESALKAVVRILAPFKGQVPPELVHQVLDIAGHGSGAFDNDAEGANDEDEADEALEELQEQVDAETAQPDKKIASQEAIPEKIEGVEKAHMDEAIAKAQGAYGEHLEKMGYKMYPDAQMAMKSHDGKPVIMKTKGEHVAKSASNVPDLSKVEDVNTRRLVENIFKSQKELIAKNEDLQAQISAQKTAERRKEIVQKAESFTHLALPKEDVVAQLEDADKIGATSFERICKSFETLNEQGKASKLFSEVGSSLAASAGSMDSLAKLEKMAEGIVQKSSDGKLTRADAFDMAIRSPEGQRLYAEYKNARVGGV